jgi:hypothetical protein
VSVQAARHRFTADDYRRRMGDAVHRGGSVEVHRQPAGPRYAEAVRSGRGERVACAAFPELAVPVDAIPG